jgi:transcriptional regulator with GAF, ATPase, and Fis domain
VKLLRFLQERQLERVGGRETLQVDARVVAATNKDLKAELAASRFREDLFYRLSVVNLKLPPLRERGEDVVLLARHFADRFARKMGRALLPMMGDAEQRLTRYEWPGNVRELANVIERAVIGARDGCIRLDRALSQGVESGAAEPAPRQPASGIRTALELQELERENIRRALAASAGRISGPGGAAERLGLKPSTLSSRIKALGITRAP